jgi:translocator protein
LYALYQALPGQWDRVLHRRIGGWVALNGALTALWNVTAGQAGTLGTPEFRPVFVVLTVVFLAGMLSSLTRVFVIFRNMDAELTRRDRWLVQVPVTVFFAWLNVAAIANTAAALLALGFTGEPYGPLWGVGRLIVATILASLVVLYSRPTIGTVVYSSVIIWAVIGILINNSSRSMPIVVTCVASSIIVILVTIYHLRRNSPNATFQPRVIGRA